MTNKEMILNKIEQINNKYNTRYELSIYDKSIDKITKKAINEALKQFHCDSTDIRIKVRNIDYMIEFTVLDSEVDIYLYTLHEYCSKYGYLLNEEDEEYYY